MTRHARPGTRSAVTLAIALALALPRDAGAQWVQQDEQFYLQAPHNWVFRDRYAAADRLFNAFDYGHAILYEKLWTRPGAPPSILEVEEYDRLTKEILVRPPRVPLEEGAIEIAYAKLAPEAKLMFEWAHVLHRQLYDVLADERLSDAGKDAEVARLLGYYRSRPDLAFSSRPKTMALMQEQPYSLAFRKRYPKFNGLIWAYHWLQVGLYEPLVAGRTPEERQSLVRAAVARFWQMLEQPVASMPHVMPMTSAIAPRFTERYPEAAIIFDNLHSMHDVISDILANPSVPRERKRAEILLAARRFRDDTSFVTSGAGWRTMAQHMGLENMGGPAVGFVALLPTPSVTYGAVMTHDPATGAMTGFAYGSATGAGHDGHAAGAATGADTSAHANHPAASPAEHDSSAAMHTPTPHDSSAAMHMPMPHDSDMAMPMPMPHDSAMAMHMRMLQDPVIRGRIMADTGLHRLVMQMMETMPPDHRAAIEQAMHGGSGMSPGTHGMMVPVTKAPPRRTRPVPRNASPKATAPPARRPPKAAPRAAPKTVAPPKAPPGNPHSGHPPGHSP